MTGLYRAADFIELAAFFADDSAAVTSDLANQSVIGAADGLVDVDGEMRNGEEEVVSSTVNRIDNRQRALGSSAYLFDLDAHGDLLTCNLRDRAKAGA